MNKIYIYLLSIVALTACSSELHYDMPDNYSNNIRFTVGDVVADTPASRATDDHKHTPYDKDIHADNLCVFGYHTDITEKNAIFDNVFLTGVETNANVIWKTNEYWENYSQYTNFNFLAYMTEGAAIAGATVTSPATNKYKLSVPCTLDAPVISTGYNSLLLCHAPLTKHTASFTDSLKFLMDQTLTGFSLWFKLGNKMDNIRDFKITKITLSGSYYTSGKATKTYTLNTSTGAEVQAYVWTSEDVKWENLGELQTIDYEVKGTNWPANYSLTINKSATEFIKWGSGAIDLTPYDGKEPISNGAFYAIPSSTFNPTITVTYDVIVDNDDPTTDDNPTITRKDVVSTIELSKTNFSNYTTGIPGYVHPIKIQIVPSYLYVLADDDQTNGILIVTK